MFKGDKDLFNGWNHRQPLLHDFSLAQSKHDAKTTVKVVTTESVVFLVFKTISKVLF